VADLALDGTRRLMRLVLYLRLSYPLRVKDAPQGCQALALKLPMPACARKNVSEMYPRTGEVGAKK